MEIILTIFAFLVQIGISIYTILFLSKLFKKEPFFYKDYIWVTILSIISIFSCSVIKIIFPLFNTIIAIIFLFITFKCALNFNIVKSTILVLLAFISTGLSEIVSYSLTSFILNKSFENLINNPATLFLVLIMQIISILLFTNIVKYILRKYTKLNLLINNITTKELIGFILLIFLCSFPQIVIFVINKYSYPLHFIITNCIQIIVICITLFIYINKSLEKNKAESELITTKLHNETMSGVVDGLKTLKHDFNNIIQALSSYSKAKEYDDLDLYIDKLLKEFKIVNTLGSIDPEIFNEKGIYGIVGAKYFLITGKGITMDIDVFTNIKEINFPMPELSRILGILLDNAFEATQKAPTPYVRLEMKFDKRKCADIIRVINTYDTNISIDFNSIYKKGFSSKKVKSGIGLWEVKKLVSRVKHSQIVPSIEDDKFIQTIIIEKNI